MCRSISEVTSVTVTFLTRLQAGFYTADHAGKLYQTIVCTAFDLLGLERLTMKNDAMMAPNIIMIGNGKTGLYELEKRIIL